MSEQTAVPAKAAELLAVAKAPQRIVEAWAANDGDAFAAACTEDATMILPGEACLQGREEIRTFMTTAYAGRYKGTRVIGEPVGVRFLNKGVSVLISRGGVLMPGETEVAGERAIQATWVLAKEDGAWLVAAYHNSPAA